MILGAILGDIVGSRFEMENYHGATHNKTKEFDLFTKDCRFTDDTVMTVAVMKALLDCGGDWNQLEASTIRAFREIGRLYPDCGYSYMTKQWILSDDMGPYNSCGNGSAMRSSPCGYAGINIEEVELLARKVTEVTHSHPEGTKGAQAAAVCVYLARKGESKDRIRAYINEHYYPLDFTLDGIRDSYGFGRVCQDTVPQAIEAFLESTGFEDAIRNAISLGGDSDTLAAIAGSIADPYYGIPENLRAQALTFLNPHLMEIIQAFDM